MWLMAATDTRSPKRGNIIFCQRHRQRYRYRTALAVFFVNVFMRTPVHLVHHFLKVI